MKKITENIFYCGVEHHDRRLFDQLVPLPCGTTYNSYLVKGSEKTALIDTVYPEKAEELINKLKEAGINKIAYIICNHGEQDHSGSLNEILELYPAATVVTNAKCKEFIMEMLHVDESKFKVITDQETLSLGNVTLQFLISPWVHWPDTMFTYVVEDKALFTTDFLGAHYPTSEKNIDKSGDKELTEAAKRYYAEIMMPFRSFCAKYVKKIRDLNVKYLLPSHGPYYSNPDFILDTYEEWTSDTPKNLVVIPYVSMYGSTELLVDYLKQSLEEKGVEVKLFDLVKSDVGELAMELVDAATIVVGTSMVLAGPHPSAINGAYLINALRPKAKYFSVIGSYGWGGNMENKLAEILGNLKVEKLDSVIIKGKPTNDDFIKVDELAEKIAEKHKSL